MRVFLAVFPPRSAQTLAARVTDALRRPGDGVSWVKPDNLHYTLRFIGEVGDDGARRVAEAAPQARPTSMPTPVLIAEPAGGFILTEQPVQQG